MNLFFFGLTAFICGAIASAAADADDSSIRHPAIAIAVVFAIAASVLSHFV